MEALQSRIFNSFLNDFEHFSHHNLAIPAGKAYIQQGSNSLKVPSTQSTYTCATYIIKRHIEPCRANLSESQQQKRCWIATKLSAEKLSNVKSKQSTKSSIPKIPPLTPSATAKAMQNFYDQAIFKNWNSRSVEGMSTTHSKSLLPAKVSKPFNNTSPNQSFEEIMVNSWADHFTCLKSNISSTLQHYSV